jgi:sterol desaturase/sphingolipid hydroxylase (fatty acid hydroxylase superfamily)
MRFWVDDRCSAILCGLKAPIVAFVDPTKRIFWPFLLVAVVLATGVWFKELRGRCSLLAFLFPRSIWLHRSALLDYRLVFARAVIDAVLLAPFTISTTATALTVARWLWKNVAIFPRSTVSHEAIAALFSIGAFVAQDFARYMVHRASHRVPALWELHKVHHSAQVLTPLTVYRTHPIESVLMRTGAALAVGIVGGVLTWLFPGKVSGWTIVGVDALLLVWNSLGSNLRHSHVWLSYGCMLEHVFISPAQHQIHHSQESAHRDSNFGSTFAIWDWLGRTLYVTRGREAVRFGLPAEERQHDETVRSVLAIPLMAALRELVHPGASRCSARACASSHDENHSVYGPDVMRREGEATARAGEDGRSSGGAMGVSTQSTLNQSHSSSAPRFSPRRRK